MFKNLEVEKVRHGVTSKDIADYIGVSYGTMRSKERDPQRLKFYEAEKIKQRLFPDVSLEILFATDDAQRQAV